jgi:uncharacterized OsmC-like protein
VQKHLKMCLTEQIRICSGLISDDYVLTIFTNKNTIIKRSLSYNVMEISQINYTGELRNTAVHLKSGSIVVTDAPSDNEGKGEAFSPTDLLSVSLATCMLTFMAIQAKKSGFKLGLAKARVIKVMSALPRKVKQIGVHITIFEGEYLEEQKGILLNAANNCPVALSLSSELIQELQIDYKHENPL